MNNKNLSFSKRLYVAWVGIRATYKKEKSLRTQFFAVLALFIFCVLRRPPLLWCALFICVSGLVICLEMLNSAVEAALDKLFPDHDEVVKFIKDCMAGAVLIASICAVTIFGLYLLSFNVI